MPLRALDRGRLDAQFVAKKNCIKGELDSEDQN